MASILRPATKNDLDAITRIVQAGFPDDPGCNYKFPYRNKHPDDFRIWTRRQYEGYLNQPEKFASLVVTIPVKNGGGADQPIAIGVWDMDVTTKPTDSDQGNHERKDINLAHFKAYNTAMDRAFAKYYESYGSKQLELTWLITHPDNRRHGAGTMLCKWGEKEALRRGISLLTVVASPIGRLLYTELGYEYLGYETAQVSGEKEKVDLFAMQKKLK